MAPNGKADRKVDAASKPPPPEVSRVNELWGWHGYANCEYTQYIHIWSYMHRFSLVRQTVYRKITQNMFLMVKPWVPHRFPAQSHDGPEDTHLSQDLMIHFLHMPRLRFIFHFDWRKAMLQSHFPVSRSNIQINPFWLFILLLAPYCMGFGLGNREIHCRWWDVPMWCLTRAVAVAFRCFLGRASAGHIERMSPSSGCRAHWIPTTRSLRAQAQGEGSRFHGFGTKLTSFCYPKYYAYHGPRIHEYINYNIYIWILFPSSSWIMVFPDFFSNFLRTELLPNDMSIMDMVPISKKPSGSSHPKHLDHFSIDCPSHFPIDVPTIFPSFSHLNCHIFPLSEESPPAAPEDLHQGAWPKRRAAAALLPPRRQRRWGRRRCRRRGGECRGRGGGERFLGSADWISNSIDIHRYMMRYLLLCHVFYWC